MRKILFVALSVFILSSCVNKVDTTKEKNPIDATENNANIEQENYDAIFSPNQDSLSIEQKELQHKLLILMKEHVKIKDGIIYSSATKEDFESHDIPLYYYNMLNENLGDMNIAIKNDGLEPQKFYDDMMKDFPEI